MKAVLEFTLPDEEHEHRLALAGGELLVALGDIRDHLRARLKYAQLSAKTRAELEEVRKLVPWELLDRLG